MESNTNLPKREQMNYYQIHSLNRHILLTSVGKEFERQRNAAMTRRIRLEVMKGQWCDVEAKCIEVSRKRTQSNMIGYLPGETSQPKSTIAMPKGTAKAGKHLEPFHHDHADSFQRDFSAAVAKVSASDRIISPKHVPIPNPVKVAVLHSYMEQRKLLYYASLLKHWKVCQ